MCLGIVLLLLNPSVFSLFVCTCIQNIDLSEKESLENISSHIMFDVKSNTSCLQSEKFKRVLKRSPHYGRILLVDNYLIRSLNSMRALIVDEKNMSFDCQWQLWQPRI